MNQRQRARKIKDITQVGDVLVSAQYGQCIVTRKSEFNCYTNGTRQTWNTIEWCMRNGSLKYSDQTKQAEMVLLYKGAKSENIPTL
jgi:hypothetical protein